MASRGSGSVWIGGGLLSAGLVFAGFVAIVSAQRSRPPEVDAADDERSLARSSLGIPE